MDRFEIPCLPTSRLLFSGMPCPPKKVVNNSKSLQRNKSFLKSNGGYQESHPVSVTVHLNKWLTDQ